MKKRWDVLGIGVVAVDDLVFVEHFPQPDVKIPVKDRQRQGGGLIATALVTAARLGCKSAYCACLGKDELSSYTIGELQREGVDCSPVQIVEGATPVHSLIIVDLSGGSRTILYSSNGFMEPDPGQITEELVRECKVLLIDSFVLRTGTHAAKLAHANNIPVVADVELPYVPEMDQFIRQVDHLIIGTAMGTVLTGKNDPEEVVHALASARRACTVITAGEQGCWYAKGNGKVRHNPAFKIDVIDSTGCGDVFHGAYATALALGESIPQAIVIATASAGLKAARPGGRTGIPDMGTVKEFLAQHAVHHDRVSNPASAK
jgi:sulfofructose kinase